MSRRLPDPTTAYARAVCRKRRPEIAGRLVRLACERHLRDLKEGKERGLYFDKRQALRALSFIATLKHTRGKWGRSWFKLAPSQEFVVGSIFGWRKEGGLRRFSTAFIEVARKWGKSELAGALALLVAFFDDPVEWGGEAYCAATKREQAAVVFNIAKKMARRSPAYRRRLKILTYRLIDLETGSYLTALGADANTLDGLSPHLVVIDELHAHPSSAVVDVMESATGAREQALQIEITTAGDDVESVCYDHHDYSVRVLDPATDDADDSWFAFIAAADEGADVSDEKAWRQANPNYGWTVPKDWYEKRARRARASPTARATFRQKILNQWQQDAKRAIDMLAWARGARELPDDDELRGRPCYGGMDLGSTDDLSALVLLWPPVPPAHDWYVTARCYVPEEGIRERTRSTKVPYQRWADEGHLVATPGEITDYDFIEADIEKALEDHDVQEIGYDRARAGEVVTHMLDKGAPFVKVGQGYFSMAQPAEDFERLIKGGRLVHGGDPVLYWCVSNLVWAVDPAGNKKPNKRRAKDKIDPVVALLMALSRAIVKGGKPPSPYAKRGVRSV